ncbi:MAG: HTH-type transcriptional activator IlvY [Pseudomonadota bacterium]
MNIKALSHFLALADHLHFGQASVASNVSVSGLSRNIKQLETEVGSVLFDRDNRSVRLTPAGERFRQYARDAVQQWQQICHELAERSTQLQGEISLYCSVTASHSILFTLLKRFRRDFSGIEIKLHTGDPELAIGRLVSGREDLAIAALPDRLPRGVVAKPMTTSPLLFIAPRDSADLVLPGSAAIDEWSRVPLILSEGGLARSRVNEWFRQQQINPHIYAQVAGNEAIVSMVSLGLGVGVVPQIVLDNSLLSDSIQVLNVSPGLEPYRVGLCTLSKSLSNPLVRAVWESGG